MSQANARIDVKKAALVMQFIGSIAFTLMNSFMPLFITIELKETLIEATYWTGLFQTVGNFTTAVAAPFWGYMCDRVGTRKILLITIVGNTVAYTGMALSNNVVSVILFRGLQGGFGGTSTIMFALISSVVDASDLKTAISYQLAAMTMSQIVGPGLGGLFASLVGYRLTFLVSALLYVSITPIVLLLRPSLVSRDEEGGNRFGLTDFKMILPDAFALILVYACINFVTPIVVYLLSSVGVAESQLLTYTVITMTLNGLTYAAATPLVTRVVSDRTLPLLSVIGAGVIFATAFATNPLQFIGLRLSIGAIQAGIPPCLLGGKSGRKGLALGLLNSFRFIGQAIGPFVATSILGEGKPQQVLLVFLTMSGVSLFTAFFTYITHTRHLSTKLL